jgi:hypothetical protein
MTIDQPEPHQHPVTQDIPLPGNYPCLTLQLNLTRYAAAKSVRWILTVREPQEGIEVVRKHVGTCTDTAAVASSLMDTIVQAICDMRYLQEDHNH